ncbi:hypothetical protein WMY93_022854 [Mugilogobius chulae]|uniref:Hermes trasposase DNA-binding domain-containing protein n=1 Tax=Mugilogobius chulae TaxID=88201 RepID=A0AAW0N3P5_9GOBI
MTFFGNSRGSRDSRGNPVGRDPLSVNKHLLDGAYNTKELQPRLYFLPVTYGSCQCDAYSTMEQEDVAKTELQRKIQNKDPSVSLSELLESQRIGHEWAQATHVQSCNAHWEPDENLRPFAVVEGAGFVSVVQELLDIGSQYGGAVRAEDLLPCARTVSRHVDGEYQKSKALVVEDLKQCTNYAVTTDLWTEEKTNTHYITVTVHYITVNWEMVNRILATKEMVGVKSGAHIRITVEEILQEFAFKDYVRLSCAGHNINLALKYVFDNLEDDNPRHSPVIKLLHESKTLVSHFKRAGLQNELDQTLKQAVETRWNSKLLMLRSINDALKSGKLHRVLLARRELRFLNNIDSELLEDIIKLLTPFDEATRHLSADKTPTLHLVLPTKATLLKGSERKVNPGSGVEIHSPAVPQGCTALSPSLRSFLRKTLSAQEYEEVINTLAAFMTTGTEERVRDHADTAEEEEGTPPVSERGTTEVHNFFSSCVEEEETEAHSDEEGTSCRKFVLDYMLQNNSKMTRGESLLGFWKEMSGGLVAVARRCWQFRQQVLHQSALSVLRGD